MEYDNKAYCVTYKKKLKDLVLGWYGGKCRCCSVNELSFLTLDHVDDSGKLLERQKNPNSISLKGRGWMLYLAIKGLGKTHKPDNLQVLCFNCQFGKQINKGFCPHNPIIDLRRPQTEQVNGLGV